MIELGTLPDWISAGATVGTFVVACMAYRSAPDWIKQKTLDVGINHVNSLLKEYDELRISTNDLYYDVISSNFANKPDLLVTTQFIANKGLNLQSNLKACGRWGITYPPETYRCFSQFINFCEIVYKIKVYQNDPLATQKLKTDLGAIKKIIDTNSDSLNTNLSDYFTYPK